MRIFQLLLILLLGNCTLAENVQKEESKDYQDTTHNVELVDYEFEERLESFYNNEPIENQDLYDLYEGEFPEGERNPKELRIHWKDARELALAELELQKDVQNWQDAEISERPILVLDKDGGDFYRYYEYRVLKDPKFVGAIRIPAYRRTENFATAEVHVYSADEKTYVVKPTAWGQYMAEKIYIDEHSEWKNLFLQQYNQKNTEEYMYNLALMTIEGNQVHTNNEPISSQEAQNILGKRAKEFQTMSETKPIFDNIHKIGLKNKDKAINNSVQKYSEYYANTTATQITAAFNTVSKYKTAEAIALKHTQVSKNLTLDNNIWKVFTTLYQSIFRGYFLQMGEESLYQHKDTVSQALLKSYWRYIEKKISLKQEVIDNNLLEMNTLTKGIIDLFIESKSTTTKLNQKSTILPQNQFIVNNIIPQRIGFIIDNNKVDIWNLKDSNNSQKISMSSILDYLDKKHLDSLQDQFEQTILHDLKLDKITKGLLNYFINTFADTEIIDIILEVLKIPTENLTDKQKEDMADEIRLLIDIAKALFAYEGEKLVSDMFVLAEHTLNYSLMKNKLSRLCDTYQEIIKYIEEIGIKDVENDISSKQDLQTMRFLQAYCEDQSLANYLGFLYYEISRYCDDWAIHPMWTADAVKSMASSIAQALVNISSKLEPIADVIEEIINSIPNKDAFDSMGRIHFSVRTDPKNGDHFVVLGSEYIALRDMNCTIQNNVLSRFFYGFPKGYRGSDYNPSKKNSENVFESKWSKESELVFIENFMKTEKYTQMPLDMRILIPSYIQYLKTGDTSEYVKQLQIYEREK